MVTLLLHDLLRSAQRHKDSQTDRPHLPWWVAWWNYPENILGSLCQPQVTCRIHFFLSKPQLFLKPKLLRCPERQQRVTEKDERCGWDRNSPKQMGEKNQPCQNIYGLLDNLTRVGRINLQIVSPSLLTSPCKKINDGLERGASDRVSLGESSQEFYYKPVPH